jgi:SsrA-binding protein
LNVWNSVSEKQNRIIARNRKARHNYILEETFEAGLALVGSEVKSIRAGHVSIAEAYVRIEDGEAWVVGMHVKRYRPAGPFGPAEDRPRRLLLHRRELKKLADGVERKGRTIVPLKLYFRGAYAKLQIALAKGKSHRDKRYDIKEREAELAAREAARAGRRYTSRYQD